MKGLLKNLIIKTSYSSGLVDWINRRKKGILALMYHSVPPTSAKGYPYSVTCEDFEKQMRFIKDHFEIIRLSKAVELLNENAPANNLKIALTFDDGYKDNFTSAYPALLKYKVPATIFLVTSYITENSDTFLNWQDIKLMKESNLVDFGAHTHRHINLNSVAASDAEKEISMSKEIIERELGQNIDYFSYPFGGVNEETKRILKNHRFKAALKDRLSGTGTDIYEIRRMGIYSCHSSLAAFTFKIASS